MLRALLLTYTVIIINKYQSVISLIVVISLCNEKNVINKKKE